MPVFFLLKPLGLGDSHIPTFWLLLYTRIIYALHERATDTHKEDPQCIEAAICATVNIMDSRATLRADSVSGSTIGPTHKANI